MIQIIVVAASILLGMILYPTLLNKINHFVNWWYWNMGDNKSEEMGNRKEKPEPEPSKISSVIGESKTKIGHDRAKATTSLKNGGVAEKESTFASDSQEETNQITDVDVPLAKVETLTEEEFDPDEEAVELEAEQGAVQASGASYDELMNAGQTITKDKPSNEEKDEAGRILYENQSTEIVEQFASKDKQTLEKVNALIRFHVIKHNLTEEGEKLSDSGEFENFDVNSIF
ncbi:hypothetical protein [Dysgonomonas sp. 511]|uniref:hypothetical protein n=1 Tax=Dysgonomonas sp. 511 TaxID=2302930 RepID=UPI0013D2D9CF|nr:hypothetical protein [Dysgonomonas sp. 511]NDV80123.1 hypothetical protein [Dysgonomonas sp. 511]